MAGALEPACRARGRPAPAREARRRAPASPVRTQRPQPDCPLGPPAAPLLHTHRPLLTLRLVRIRSDVTVRLKSVRFGCALQKSDVSARAPHNRPTRRCTFHLPGRTPSLSHPEPAQPTYPANASSGLLHPAPAHPTYPSERPSQPPVAPSEASMAGPHNSPTRQGCTSRHRGPQVSACRPHPAPPIRRSPHGPPRGTGSASPHVLSPHPDYPANQAQRRFGTPFNTRELARKSMGDVKSTGLGRDRLRSVDRNNKTTLLLTRRCGTNKSYAKDLSPRMVKLQDVS